MNNGSIRVGDVFEMGESRLVITSVLPDRGDVCCLFFERKEDAMYDWIKAEELYKKRFLYNILDKCDPR